MTTPLNNKKGTTLVELMVCLVLLALFGTAAVTLVKPCAEAYIEAADPRPEPGRCPHRDHPGRAGRCRRHDLYRKRRNRERRGFGK